jgi:hypothetical protein
MNSSWYTDNNPQGLTMFGLTKDRTPEQIWTKQNIADWPDSSSRTWYMPDGGLPYYGFRIQVDKTNKSEAGNDFHTSIGDIRVYGHPQEPRKVIYDGEQVTYNGEVVTYAGNTRY